MGTPHQLRPDAHAQVATPTPPAVSVAPDTASRRQSGRRLSIDFLIRSLGQGGAERQLVLLASGLARRGHRIRILTFYPGGSFETEALARGLEVLCLNKRGRWDILPFLLRLHMARRGRNADVLHSYMTTSNLVAAILKPLHPQRVVWGLRASDLDLSQYDWLAQASSWLEARLSKTVDLIITNSTAGRRHAVSIGFPPGAIHVINNGFDIERWQRDPDAGARFRTIHELPANAPLVGLVARLDPLKGHRLFLEAAARLSDSQPGTHFVLVGAGPAALKAELQAFAHRLCPQLPVHWIGGQADMVPVYSALDCLVSASSSEGFPNVIAEAMACGLRPVVTDVGDSRDIVGSCGWVVPPGNAARMAGAIAEALSANRSSRPDPVVHIRTMYGLERLIDRSEALLGPELQ